MALVLEGKLIVFTGTLAMKRAEAKALAIEHGGKVGASVTGKTDIMVTGTDVGAAKTAAAEKHGVEVWTEAKFMDAVAGGGAHKTAKKRAAPAAKAPAKRATKKAKAEPADETVGCKWEFEGDDGWQPFAGVDADMLEAEFEKRGVKGAKAKFKTKDFSFNTEHGTNYEINFAKMTQTNTESKNSRNMRRTTEAEEGEEEEKPVAKKAKVKAPPKKAAAKAKAEVVEAAPGEAEVAPSASGARKADRSVPSGESYTVVDDYDCKLMQTNLGDSNNNKFYIIQVLEKDCSYWIWNRWGRLGANGQSKLMNCSSEDAAIKDFQKKFKDKTKNNWDDRDNFVKHTGKYQLVEVEVGDDDAAAGAALGKLTEAQINKGQAVLEQIKDLIGGGQKSKSSSQLCELSGQFYSFIPTQSDKSLMAKLEVIDNIELLEEKEAKLEFWLRMGFEDLGPELKENPLEGLKDRAVPASLADACKGGVSDMSNITSSTKRGVELAKVHAPKNKLAQEVWPAYYGAIILYTGNSIYKALNKALREQHAKVPKYLNYLRLLMHGMSQMPKNKTQKLWRGIGCDLFDEYAVGKVITWWSVSSCTSSKTVAESFMSSLGGGATFITLTCTTAVDVSAYSIYPSEKESLLPPGTMLKVLSRTRKGKVTHIEVEEVGTYLDA